MADGWGVTSGTNAPSIPSDNLDNPDITSGAWRYTSSATGLPSGHAASSGTLVVTREDSASGGNARYIAHDRAGRMWNRVVEAGAAGAWEEIYTASSETIAAPYMLPEYRGLKISEFLTSDDPAVDQSAEVLNALAALMTDMRYTGLDFEGRNVGVSGVLDVAAKTGPISTSLEDKNRWLHNGQITALTAQSVTTVQKSTVDFVMGSTTAAMANAGSLAAGMSVESAYVPRCTYIVSVDTVNDTIEMSMPAWHSITNTTVDFKEYPTLLDLSGYDRLKNFTFSDFHFELDGKIGLCRLPKQGARFKFSRLQAWNVLERGVIDWGVGVTPIIFEQIFADPHDNGSDPGDRTSVFANINRNDNKIRFNQVQRFRHAWVVHGGSTVYVGNHDWQGKSTGSTRTACVVFTDKNAGAAVVANEIDNSYIELTDESASGDSNRLGDITIVGNKFTMGNEAAADVAWIELHPFTQNRKIGGIFVSDNLFRNPEGGQVTTRVEKLNTNATYGNYVTNITSSIDENDVEKVVFKDNEFTSITYETHNPMTALESRDPGSGGTNFNFNYTNYLPFGLGIKSIKACSAVRVSEDNVNKDPLYLYPRITYGTADGLTSDLHARAQFSQNVIGEVYLTVDVGKMIEA